MEKYKKYEFPDLFFLLGALFEIISIVSILVTQHYVVILLAIAGVILALIGILLPYGDVKGKR